MRVKINLTAENNITIPIEYNYSIYLNLRKTIFEFLRFQKPKFYSKYKKEFPPFTFSQLMIPERKVEAGFIKIRGNYLSLFLSSVDESFMEYLVKSINHEQKITISSHPFQLKKIEILEEPIFYEEMKFKMLSPMLLIRKQGDQTYFINPEDSELSNIFASQLQKNYQKQFNRECPSENIKLTLDQGYLIRKKKLTRLVSVNNIHYKTIFCPFSLKGSIELIKYAYHNGVGTKTHYGFGMIDIAH